MEEDNDNMGEINKKESWMSYVKPVLYLGSGLVTLVTSGVVTIETFLDKEYLPSGIFGAFAIGGLLSATYGFIEILQERKVKAEERKRRKSIDEIFDF